MACFGFIFGTRAFLSNILGLDGGFSERGCTSRFNCTPRNLSHREIFDRTSVDIHLPSAPPEAFRYASLYWGILLSIMLASVCGMTILMWLRIEDLGVENSATSSIHIRSVCVHFVFGMRLIVDASS